jgi:hypothetical protein
MSFLGDIGNFLTGNTAAVQAETALAKQQAAIGAGLPGTIANIQGMTNPNSPSGQMMDLQAQQGGASGLNALKNAGYGNSSKAGNWMQQYMAQLQGQKQGMYQQGQSQVANLQAGQSQAALQSYGEAAAQQAAAQKAAIGGIGSLATGLNWGNLLASPSPVISATDSSGWAGGGQLSPYA